MDKQLKNIYWLAGLLEGEGSFGFYRDFAVIQLAMNDYDTIVKAQAVFGHNTKISQFGKAYKISVGGDKAIGWMFTLYSLLGNRRQTKIKEIVIEWKNHGLRMKEIRSTFKTQIINGIKVCSKHGPVTGINTVHKGRYIYCRGCHRGLPTTSKALKSS